MDRTAYYRVASVDILRGLVMIIMALDHTRDYFSNYQFDPLNLDQANAAYFFTRWITHFCAPVFVFLSGSSAFLSTQKATSKRQRAVDLVVRGIWLIVLEVTIIRFGWEFNFVYDSLWVQVIWVIGWSMVILAGLIFLPLSVIAIIALAMIFGHNLFDGIKADNIAMGRIWWDVLHQPGGVMIGATQFYVLYPLVPWVGVMAAGYCFGGIIKKPGASRDRWCYTIGVGAVLLFIVLRWSNVYGNPQPWKNYDQDWISMLSFLNCEKYPPSLLFLLMTLGPAIALMPFLEKINDRVAAFLSVYGRVPLFYYVVHIFLIHLAAMITGISIGFPKAYFTTGDTSVASSDGWGFPLGVVYTIWVLVVVLLYYPCKRLMQAKMRSRKRWLRYI
jgi:uncharacterized membrane protein